MPMIVYRKTDGRAQDLRFEQDSYLLQPSEYLYGSGDCLPEISSLNDPPTYEESKAAKLAALAAYHYAREIAGTTLNGILISTNRENRGMITDTLKYLENKPEGTTVNWKAESGWAQIDYPTLLAIGIAVAEYIEACYDNYRNHETAIIALATQEDLDAYDFTGGWP